LLSILDLHKKTLENPPEPTCLMI